MMHDHLVCTGRVERFPYTIQFIIGEIVLALILFYNSIGMENVSFYTFRDLENEMLAFVNAYHVETVISTAMPIMQLKSKDERVCRFCKSGPNGALFKNKAHLLPELLGNHTLFSDSECDACNKHFGKYENDLAYSLGMLRAFVGTIGKEKVPVFKSPGEIITARPEYLYGSKTAKISRKDVTDKSIKLDAEKGLVEISYIKNPYRPLYVYKSLLKIALAIMPEESLKAYQKTIYYLLLRDRDELNPKSALVLCQYLPFHYATKQPSCILFRKNDPEANLPTHVFSLNFEHITYQFPLPLNTEDEVKGFKNPIVPLCPPLFAEPPKSAEHHYAVSKDFSSKELLRGENETFVFQFDPGLLNKLKSFDPKTGKYAEAQLKPEDLAGFYFFDKDNPPKLPGSNNAGS